MTYKHMVNNWEYFFGVGGLLATITVADYNKYIAAIIGTVTAAILVVRLFVWIVRAYQTWRDRKQPWKGTDKEI